MSEKFAGNLSKNSVNALLVDTTVWIDLSRGGYQAADFLSTARRSGRITCSVINIMEVMLGDAAGKHQRALSEMFKPFEVLPVTEEDGWQALRILQSSARHSGIGVLDALIAATAIREKLTLATHNLKHFNAVSGLKTIKPY